MKVAVSVPVYISSNAHKDFLNKCTQSIKTSHELIVIMVENRLEPQYKPFNYLFAPIPQGFVILEGRQPQAVSKAWNDAIKKAAELECDYILLLGSDTVLKSNAIDRLVSFAELHQEAILWSMSTCPIFDRLQDCAEGEGFNDNPEFNAFMVQPKRFFELLGKGFDENLAPAYFEDNDITARIVLSNHKAFWYNGAKYYHFGSRTINEDDRVRQQHYYLFRACEAYFKRKWGRTPVSNMDEIKNGYYQYPFNDSSKPLNDWEIGT